MRGQSATIVYVSPRKRHCDLPPVPDLHDQRFCRACNMPLPLSHFIPGQRRFFCREHFFHMRQRPYKARIRNDPPTAVAHAMWKTTWKDAKTVFDFDRIHLTVGAIIAMFSLDKWQHMVNFLNMREFDHKPNVGIVPVKPQYPVSVNNYAIVPKDLRLSLHKVYRRFGSAAYTNRLEAVSPIVFENMGIPPAPPRPLPPPCPTEPPTTPLAERSAAESLLPGDHTHDGLDVGVHVVMNPGEGNLHEQITVQDRINSWKWTPEWRIRADAQRAEEEAVRAKLHCAGGA